MIELLKALLIAVFTNGFMSNDDRRSAAALRRGPSEEELVNASRRFDQEWPARKAELDARDAEIARRMEEDARFEGRPL